MHALHLDLGEGGRGKKGGLSEYARTLGRDKDTISKYRMAAEVLEGAKLSTQVDGLLDKAKHLSALHALPRDCWPGAVEAMLKGECITTTADIVGNGRRFPEDGVTYHWRQHRYTVRSGASRRSTLSKYHPAAGVPVACCGRPWRRS